MSTPRHPIPPAAPLGATQKPDGRQTRHAHRRGELIQAATDYIAEHGFENLSIRPLADGIGVTHATLLHHFGTKDTLLAEVLYELRERDRRLIAAEGDRLRGAPLEMILRNAWTHLSAPTHRPYWGLVFRAYGVALANPELYARFLDGAVTDWLALGDDILYSSQCPPAHRSALATLIVGSFRGILLDLLVTDDLQRTGQAVDQLIAAVLLRLDQIRSTQTNRPAS